MLLQYAIEQSLLDNGGASSNNSDIPIEQLRQIQLQDYQETVPVEASADTEFFRAIRDSQADEERRRREEEQFEEELRKVLELSKTEQ